MIETLIAIAALAIGALVGYLIASNHATGALSDARTEASVARERADAMASRVAEVTAASGKREEELKADLEARLAEVKASQAQQEAQFKALAADVLKDQREQFQRSAEERAELERRAAAAEDEQRQLAMKNLVEPMAKALDEVKRQTTDADKGRREGQAALAEQVRQMVDASSKLDKRTADFINTLRRSDVRGNWGEVQLKRVVELSGMLNHVDFTEQENVKDSEGKNLRPDMTVRLAGGRTIVVDSKVALAGLLEAFETDDERVRTERLAAHARQVRKHIDDLASKKYWEQFESAPEFVVMFVPAEGFYQSALEQDDTLQEYAFSKRVVIATPTTLVALLRAVAHAWKEDALAKNAQQVLATGKDLYDRLIVMGNHLSRVGRAIDSASKAYNQTVASMESRVMVTARKFGEMQHIDAELPQLDVVETEVRHIASTEPQDDED
jgi:DNA recombination protein RmuC